MSTKRVKLPYRQDALGIMLLKWFVCIVFKTISVKHELTPWESLEGTKSNYCFLLVPGKDGVKYRRYVYLSCSNCRDLKFLQCTNAYCGPWKQGYFNINSKTLKSYLSVLFGPGKKQRQNASKLILKLITAYYRCIKV